jgi:hypothetical protein
MTVPTVPMDNQPISATFFGEGKWLTDFITPDALDIKLLHDQLTEGESDLQTRLAKLHKWVATQVKYVRFVKGKMWVQGKLSEQNDLWNDPSVTARVHVGNCANKAFLLTSLLRSELPENSVYCVLGNLYNGKAEGHAWAEVVMNGQNYIMESTIPTAPPFVLADISKRYEPVHYFNDKVLLAVPGRTVMTPFAACYSDWLASYLDWGYIEGRK